MPSLNTFSLPSLNLKLSPFLQPQGAILRALNVERDSIGAYTKRPGYVTFLGTPDNSQVNTLFNWVQNDGVTNTVYRASGSILYHSISGTGAWTTSGNGTITNNSHFGYTVLDNVLIGGDGTSASRHSTNGTSFTNTTSAPLAELWAEYQGRVWAARGTAVSGTNTDMFYSTVGTATDWTTDSSSLRVPGAGRVNSLFKAGDRLVSTKDSGNMFRWDGFSLIDLATNLGPSSRYSIGEVEDFRLYLNRQGVYGFGGGKPNIISNSIERQIYNNLGSGIAGTTFDNAPGIAYKYDYYCSIGTITDDLVRITIPNAVLRYDLQLDEWTNWQFANRPTSFGTYLDTSSNVQMIFGDSGGQCYQMSGTALSDNGSPIEVQLMGFIHGGSLNDKKWDWIRAMFNPGCRAKIQIAITDNFSTENLNWQEIGDANNGVVEFRFPSGSRGKFCFYKIYESSTSSRFEFYGIEHSASEISHG